MNIIAVDDEQIALNDLMDTIRQAAPDAQLSGYTLAEDALAYARGRRVDVAFLDMRMAELDGLGLAEKLKRLNPHINVIAVTGYSEYALAAHRAHVSGFLEKPARVEAVQFELSVLRNSPKAAGPPRVRVQCFGSFGVFVRGQPLLFTRAKPKELFAYLVHKKGASVGTADIAAVLWEDCANDNSLQTQARKARALLLGILKEAGVEDIIRMARNSMAVDIDKIACDYYDYCGDTKAYAHTFHGEYLNEYSWAEPTQAFLISQIK